MLLSRPWEELLSMLSSAAGVKEAAAALDVLLSCFGCCWTDLGVRHLAAMLSWSLSCYCPAHRESEDAAV